MNGAEDILPKDWSTIVMFWPLGRLHGPFKRQRFLLTSAMAKIGPRCVLESAMVDQGLSSDNFLPVWKANSKYIRIGALLASFFGFYGMNDEVLHGEDPFNLRNHSARESRLFIGRSRVSIDKRFEGPVSEHWPHSKYRLMRVALSKPFWTAAPCHPRLFRGHRLHGWAFYRRVELRRPFLSDRYFFITVRLRTPHLNALRSGGDDIAFYVVAKSGRKLDTTRKRVG